MRAIFIPALEYVDGGLPLLADGVTVKLKSSDNFRGALMAPPSGLRSGTENETAGVVGGFFGGVC